MTGASPVSVSLSGFSLGAVQGVGGSPSRQPGHPSAHGPASQPQLPGGLLLPWARGWGPGRGLGV